jgi:replicative DNA helicase
MNDESEVLFDTQAEAGVIATLVHHPEFILHSEYLKAGYFYHKENGCIYWAIDELFKSGVKNIDAFNISNMLQSNAAVKKKIESVNMPDMDEFVDMCEDAARNTIEEYNFLVAQVVTMSFKRDLVKLFDKMKKKVIETSMELNELSNDVYSQLEKLTGKYIFDNRTLRFGDKVKDIYQEIKDRRGEGGVAGIQSKYSGINKYFCYENGELIMVSGRMKMGKSSFMLNEAMDKIQKGIATVYFDTEMNDRLFYIRMMANLTGIPQDKIKTGNLAPEEEKIIDDTNIWLEKQPFVHIFIPNSTNEELYVICKMLKYSMNLQFVIYDYFKSSEADSSAQYNDLGAKCDFMKNRIAGELDLAVLAGAQLNRNDEVADSDKLERYASVSAKWRKKTSEEIANDGKDCGNYAMNIKLNRLGEGMFDDEYIDFKFAGSVMRIEQAKQHQEEETPY